MLVVGASSGIGRGTGLAASAAGASVGFCARRRDRLDDAVAGAGEGCLAVVADVTREEECRRLVDETAAALGGIDALVYATAVTHLQAVAEVDAATWRRILETNVVGASQVTRHALPHLRAGWGRVVYLSSDSVGWPFPGLGPYTASKAALDSIIESWRREHPELAITKVIAGPTATEAATAWDPERMVEYLERWAAEGYVRGDVEPAMPEDVGRQIVEILATDPAPDLVDLAPPRPWQVA